MKFIDHAPNNYIMHQFYYKKKTTRTMKLWNYEINDKMKIWAWKYETQIGKKMIRWLFKLLM